MVPTHGGPGEEAELDYLAPAQLAVDPESFAQVVREVYNLEYGCTTDVQIAEVLGRDKSRICQIFSHPETLKAETVRMLLEPIASEKQRRRILRAWVLECVGEDVDRPPKGGRIGPTANEKTLRRVDRQIRESRLRTAAKTASEAFGKAQDLALQEQFLDRAYFANQRIDEPGAAMAVARLIAIRAAARRDGPRLGAAHLYRSRILAGLEGTRPQDLWPIFDEAVECVRRGPHPPTPPPYSIADAARIATSRDAATLTLMERGELPLDPAFLESALASFLRAAKSAKGYQQRYHAVQTAARIRLLRGETFQARELVDAAFGSGGRKNLMAAEMSGLIVGRILAETDGPETAVRHLRAVRRNCRNALDNYHARLADWDVARLESGLFPTIW